MPGEPSLHRLFVSIDEGGRCLVITELTEDGTQNMQAQAYVEPCEELGWIDDMRTFARGTWPEGVIAGATGTIGVGDDGILRYDIEAFVNVWSERNRFILVGEDPRASVDSCWVPEASSP